MAKPDSLGPHIFVQRLPWSGGRLFPNRSNATPTTPSR